MEKSLRNLTSEYKDYLKHNPNSRIRNAASELGVSEVELIVTKIGSSAIRLKSDVHEILKRIESLGYVMALSRNNEVVHERKGIYKNGSFNAHVSLFVSPDIDLRMFTSHWKYCFAVNEESKGQLRRSIQFFLDDGQATHKIYLTSESNIAAYDKLVSEFTDEIQSPKLELSVKNENRTELKDSEIDFQAFQEEWLALKDTHDFFMLMRKHKLSRTQALRLAPAGGYAIKMKNNVMRNVITAASETQTPIMVFVGNKGIIQIHTGPVNKLIDHKEWFNILDPKFNLHVKESHITQSWIVRKPTVDGIVTSLEMFNEKDELILTLFGKRKPGNPELEEWRKIISEIERTDAL